MSVKHSSHRVHDDMGHALSELQHSVERLQELLEEILDQAEQDKMGQAQEVSDSLEAEIKELRKRDTEMKDLAQCEDHIYYLQVRKHQIFHVIHVMSHDCRSNTKCTFPFRLVSPCAAPWSLETCQP